MKKAFAAVVMLLFFVSTVSAGQLIVTTSDYESGNTAVYNTGTGDFNGAALGQDDQDIIVDSDGENVYFISRTLGSVAKYDADLNGMIWQYSVGAGSNPHDIVFLEEKAYVIRYGAQEILVVDQNAGSQDSFELGTIDISAYDENGTPEATYGFVCDGMVYVVMQRLNGWTAEIPGYVIKIDPETDTILDLDPATDGVQGIELLVKNPAYFAQVGNTAYIGGHDWSGQTEGVLTLDLGNVDLPQSMLLDEETMFMDITGVKVFDETLAIFYSSAWVEVGGEWVQEAAAYWFDPATGAMGEALPIPTPDGGAVKVGDIVYVGSRDNDALGIYPVDPSTNTLAGDIMTSSLPPMSMVYIESGATAVNDEAVPESFALDAPYPNPFNPSTTLSFSLSDAGMTSVEVFNLAGQKVTELVNMHLEAGNHSVVWNAGNVSNGVYFISVKHGNTVQSAKVVLVK